MMPFPTATDLTDAMATSAYIVIPCADLDAAIDYFTQQLGFRLDMIMPADAPRMASISGHGVSLQLEVTTHDTAACQQVVLRLPELSDEARHAAALSKLAPGLAVQFKGTAACSGDAFTHPIFGNIEHKPAWHAGRAGMQYRDLIPDRLGGRVIASHIRIPDGGVVPDYVHYHEVVFQMIYCRRGWVRVVYEDQGPPFVMQPGDCVLQPPRIRHRVLEASPGLEVIEIGCPAEHATWRDHELPLPTDHIVPDRDFSGQRFLRHVAADTAWQPAGHSGFSYRETGVSNATSRLASASLLRANVRSRLNIEACPGATFLMCLKGRFSLSGDGLQQHSLRGDDACIIPPAVTFEMTALDSCQLLQVRLPADDQGCSA